MLREAIVAAIAIAFCISGCSAPRSPRIVTNPDPAGKIPAYKKAVREKDLSVIRQLVKDLDSDDPAVRMFAIQALEELTGQRYGYTYYHDELQRRDSLGRWRDWLAKEEGAAPQTPVLPTTRPADESRLVGSKPGE
jgi:hypothetical protein